MTESQLLNAVIDLAKLAGFRACHFRPARTDNGWRTALQGDKGWPDLAICGHGRFIVAELKSDRGEASSEQVLWLTALLQAGIEAHVWRPRDWDAGTIAEVLGCNGRVIRRDTP